MINTQNLILRLVLVLSFVATAAFAQPLENFPVANGQVHAIAKYGNTIYLGGEFKSLGTATGSFAIAGSTTSNFITETSPVAGNVQVIISDGNNGWYVGGEFEGVGASSSLKNLVHILSTGVVDTAFTPNPNAAVLSLALQGSTLYVGGSFSSLGGQTRTRFGAVDATTGTATSLNLSANGTVEAMTTRSGVLYLGGSFSTFGGSSRSRLAAVDLGTGLVTAWDPGASAVVLAIQSSTAGVYVGGVFTTIGGVARNYLAEVDTSGTTTGFNPSPNSVVYALASNATDLFVGGTYTSIGGSTRYALSAFNLVSQVLASWDPSAGSASGPIYGLATDSDSVFAAGLVTTVAGVTVSNVYDIDSASGAIESFRPAVNGQVEAIAVSAEGNVAIGGLFSSVGTKTDRRYFAAIDSTTGSITSLDLNPNNYIRAMKVVGSTLYVAGDFTQIGGVTRNKLAAVDLTSGSVLSTPDLSINNGIYCLEIQGNTAYTGGTFTTFGGVSRNRAAAVDLTGGTVTSWDPNAGGTVYAIAPASDGVFVAGNFTSIGGAARNYVAKLSSTTGIADGGWDANASGAVRGLALDGSTLYVVGPFSTIGGVARGSVAALNASTGAVTSFNPGVNNTPYALALLGSKLYVGGQFTSTTQPTTAEHRGVFSVDTTSGTIDSLNPRINPGSTTSYGVVSTLYASSNSVYAGGLFGGMYSKPYGNFGVVDAVVSASVAPTISGTAQDGQALTNATLGTWEGVPPISYTRQWQRCDSSGASCVDQSGETGSGYTLVAADVGSTVRVNVTATDAVGSSTVSSSTTAIVKPLNSGAPSISGTGMTETALTSSEGSWNGATGLTLSYAWKRCDSSGSNCSAISGQTASTYTPNSTDVGSTIRVAVTASKNGSDTVTSSDSSQTGVIAASLPDLKSELRSVKKNKTTNKITGSLLCSNIGTGSAGSFTATVYLSKDKKRDSKDIRVKSSNVSALSSGAASSAIKFSRASKSGYKYIVGVCDSGSRVSEASETNNSSSKAVK